MSDNKKYYYMKLKDNFFDTDEMIMLQSMPDGYLYSDILLKLYLRSLKNDGRLMFNDMIPYNAQMIATITRHQVGTVEKALNIFSQLKLIEVLDSGAIYMMNIQNYIGNSSTEADRIRAYRAKIKKDEKKLDVTNVRHLNDKSTPEKEIELASSSLRSEYAGNSTSDEDGDCCNSPSVSGEKADDIFTDLLDKGGDGSSDGELKMVTDLIKKGGFAHRLPAPGQEPSKTIKECISKISDIASANFLKWNFDPEWLKGICTMKHLRTLSDGMFKFSDAVDLIDSVLDDFNQSKEPGYWPRDKKVLPKSFSDFLFNDHTGKSWFIQFLVKGSRKNEEADNQKYVDALPKEFRKVLGRSDLDWNKHLPRIARNVADLADWHERTKGTLDRYTDYSWLFYREDFWESYISYVADLLDGDHPCPGHFRPYGKTHQSWMAMEHDEHEVDWTYLGKVKGERERGYDDEI